MKVFVMLAGLTALLVTFVNPLASIRGKGVMRLFRTHPPTEERVSRLREQASRGEY